MRSEGIMGALFSSLPASLPFGRVAWVVCLTMSWTIPGVWVAYDASRRDARYAALWGLGALAWPQLLLPVWLARRPLIGAETREGGFAWNLARSFVLVWTAYMVLATILFYLLAIVRAATALGGDDGTAALAHMATLGALGIFWFFPVLGALVFGLVVRNPSVVERGPDARGRIRHGVAARDSGRVLRLSSLMPRER